MMKKALSLIGILIIVLLSFVIFSLLVKSAADRPAKYSKKIKDRIERVENGLTSWVQTPSLNLKWSIEERMLSYKVPGVSIAVINDYKIEWVKGYGWADVDEQRPVTAQTRFQAASISKSLNAVGVLRLAQDGVIDLNSDINQYLTSWKFPYDSITGDKKITMLNLLSHTAGLTIHGFPGYAKGVALPAITDILDGRAPANTGAVRSQSEPEIRAQYSGGGTTILQLIVEDITRQPYAEYMHNRVFTPMKISGSSYSQPPLADARLLATAYIANMEEVQGKYHIYPEQAAAGLWTNPTDLAKYVIELQLAYAGRSGKLFSQETARLMLTPFMENNATISGGLAAPGLFIERMGDETYFQHSGSNRGFLCQYYGSLSNGKGVVVMTNASNSGIIREIINSVATVYNWKEFYNPIVKETITPLDLDKYQGKYITSNGSTYDIFRRDNELFISNNLPRQIYFTSEADFFVTEARGDYKFLFDDSGKVTGFIIGNETDGRRADRFF